MTAQESHFAEHETFQDDITLLEGFDVHSPAVAVLLSMNATAQRWTGSVYHPRGKNTYCYDSGDGALIEIDGPDSTCVFTAP